MSVELYVKRTKRCFDIIFCDPPFDYQYKWDLIEAIGSSHIVKDRSLLLLHRPREDDQSSRFTQTLNEEDLQFFLVKENIREYGRSIVDFYRLKKFK